MKKWTALLIVLLIVLAGCSGRRDTSKGGGDSDASPSAAAESSAVQEQQEPNVQASSQPAVLTLTVPEGYTLPRIGMVLEDMGVCTALEFIDASQAGNFSDFPLVAQQQENENRCFKLEGYLFPDTYQIYADESPESIIRKMLGHLESKFTPGMRADVELSGWSVDEVLALASIIEKEAFGHEQMPGISSVLHNRLDAGMMLQCDVTINYVEGAIKPFITGDENRYNSYYNTYKCEGIPAGAICNPGVDAINAALSPIPSDYLYFVTDEDKNYYYAEDFEQHKKNKVEAGVTDS